MDDRIDAMAMALVSTFSVPRHHLAVPVNDGTWTTPLADALDAWGLRDEANAERARVLGPPVPRYPDAVTIR